MRGKTTVITSGTLILKAQIPRPNVCYLVFLHVCEFTRLRGVVISDSEMIIGYSCNAINAFLSFPDYF